ncbi:MAG: ribonuclease HII [Gemmatimonadetes bacterium]|nr:ribonuclease HII [Gemmatimonadota bacterium]NIR77744.1 ribonuclease HII [Gemmatimonadota bacterium]NIT86281.1 ribonuclease HII [Gemmatimonadota bacterium]NIU30114.1 ribonuclease HII [Gemmatimonadota bacterium]NIU35058.1 ribonuclease HII [Gemmatimonadota bacterium]
MPPEKPSLRDSGVGGSSDPDPEDSRPPDPLAYERRFWGRCVVVGVDEVGRGPLAGPVVAAAVVLPPRTLVEGAADSKTLSPGDRERLAREIGRAARTVSLGASSVREIDRTDILKATTLAMRRALNRLEAPRVQIVVDGRPVRKLGWEHDAVVGGDDRIHSIACASIVAKVCRDRLMRKLAARHPGYGWETNVGYATAEHLDALRRLGPTPHHRLTFGGVQYELELG